MAENKRKQKKGLKAAGIVLAVLLLLVAGFTVISHAVHHRSDMAEIVEIYFRISGTKKKFADPKECADYIELRRSAEDYTLTARLKSDASEITVNGNRVYHLTSSDQPEIQILYLHGGAYINDASVYHWKLCDRLAQDLNAEVVFPIYPLTPNHTWGETFDLVTQVYQEMLAADVPVILMGDSAGGGLAAAFCESLADNGLPQPDRLILFSPWLDVGMTNPEAADYESADPMLSAYGLIEMGRCWAGDLPLDDYHVSPIFGDVSQLRNVTLFVGTREIFYPDITAFYDLLQKQGIETTLHIGEGMNHVYPLYPIPEADEAFAQITAAIRQSNN